MAEIITLDGMRSTRAGRRTLRGQDAEIILFPGVFYEYLDTPVTWKSAAIRNRKPTRQPKAEGRGRSNSRTS